jgi:hypothetical protein
VPVSILESHSATTSPQGEVRLFFDPVDACALGMS